MEKPTEQNHPDAVSSPPPPPEVSTFPGYKPGFSEEFKRKPWQLLDWGITIPDHLKRYQSWEEKIREVHSALPEPPSGDGEEQPQPQPPERARGVNVSLLRKQYDMQIGLYEKYLTVLINFAFFHFAISGAIISFSLRYVDAGLMQGALAFPFMMNLFFAVLLLLAFRSLKNINQEIIYMSRFFGFQPPSVRTLRHALAVNFLLLISLALSFSPTIFNVNGWGLYRFNLNNYKLTPGDKGDGSSGKRAGEAGGRAASALRTPEPDPVRASPKVSQ